MKNVYIHPFHLFVPKCNLKRQNIPFQLQTKLFQEDDLFALWYILQLVRRMTQNTNTNKIVYF